MWHVVSTTGTDGYTENFEFALTAPDVGHFGGCGVYAHSDGDCAMQSGGGFEGDAGWDWAVAAVAAMTTAQRHTEKGICRAWFGDDDDEEDDRDDAGHRRRG